MEAGGGLFDEQPEIQAGEVSMPAGNDAASSVSSEPISVKKTQQAQKAAAPAPAQKGMHNVHCTCTRGLFIGCVVTCKNE